MSTTLSRGLVGVSSQTIFVSVVQASLASVPKVGDNEHKEIKQGEAFTQSLWGN